jgi:hypothetical protein
MVDMPTSPNYHEQQEAGGQAPTSTTRPRESLAGQRVNATSSTHSSNVASSGDSRMRSRMAFLPSGAGPPERAIRSFVHRSMAYPRDNMQGWNHNMLWE